MTTPTALRSSLFQQAFLGLDAATRMWIQMRAQQIASAGVFGATEISAFRQQVVARFGPAAATGAPSLVEIAIWHVLQVTAQSRYLNLQNSLQPQQQMMQTLSNISKLLHDTATSVISNLRG
jgi:hypothetical protein